MPPTTGSLDESIVYHGIRSQRRPTSITPPHVRGSPPQQLSHSTRQRRTQAASPTQSFVLTCGAEANLSVPSLHDPTLWGSFQKWEVPILPLPLDDSHPSPMSIGKPSTGCGAIIHTSASPRGLRTWLGCADAIGSTAISLPAEYFTEDQKCLLGGGPKTKDCGCVTVGMGCCVCGNTLGVHRTFCQAHISMLNTHTMSYTFLAGAVSPPLPQRRKVPIVIDVAEPRTPTIDDPRNLVNWLSQSREISRRPDSPTHSELVELGMQEEARIQAEEEEARIQAVIAHARAIHSSVTPRRTPATREEMDESNTDTEILPLQNMNGERGFSSPGSVQFNR